MALAQHTYTVPDPATQTYAIPFDYLRAVDISVEVDGSASGVTFSIVSGDVVIATPTLLPDQLVTVKRTTAKTVMLTSFNDPAALRRSDLNAAFRQLLFICQELVDAGQLGLPLDLADSKWNAGDVIIKNVADPTSDQDAATKTWVESLLTSSEGVLPTPASGDALKFLRVKPDESGYTLAESLTGVYIYKIKPQTSGPVGWNSGWVLPAYGGGYNNSTSQRAPLQLILAHNDNGDVSLAANTFDLTLAAGQWVIEVDAPLRGLTDTAFTNGTTGQMAITDNTGATAHAESVEVITGTATQQMTSHAKIIYPVSLAVTTTINLRGRGSTSSHSVVADTPSYLTVRRVTR